MFINKGTTKKHSLLKRLALAFLAVPLYIIPAFSAENEVKAPDALHGQPWAFGQSAGRKDALWHKGIGAEAVTKGATPQKKKPEAVDTSGGIDRAINNVVEKEKKGKLGLSMGNQASSWKVDPNAMRADEFRPRDRQHVVRAFADLPAGEDLDIKIGPELILRDERAGEDNAHEKQPDSSLGVGMHFKFDF